MKSLLFLYNPAAGKGLIRPRLAEILDVFTKAGYLVSAYPTQKKGDASRIAKTLGGRFDRIVCAGGDGTLSETVTGLMEAEKPAPLGYLPCGSTNDCAKTLRIPTDLAEAAAVAAKRGVARPMDIGALGGKPFVYVAAFGAFTSVSYDTPQELKNAFGHLAYILAGVASIPTITPYHLRVEYDGNVLEDEFLLGVVCNSVSVGGIQAFSQKEVKLDDGLFEIVLIRNATTPAERAAGLQYLLQHKPQKDGPVTVLRAAKVRFACEKAVPWTIDGEFGGKHRETVVENHRKALTIIQGD